MTTHNNHSSTNNTPNVPLKVRSKKLKNAPIKRDIRFTNAGWKKLQTVRVHFESILGHSISYSFALDKFLMGVGVR